MHKSREFEFYVPGNRRRWADCANAQFRLCGCCKSLGEKGFVKWIPNVLLVFNLTIQGYEKIHNQRMQSKLSWKDKLLIAFNKYGGLIALIGLPVSILGTLYTVWSYYK